MSKTNHLKSTIGYAIAFAVVGIAIVWMLCTPSPSHGANVCRQQVVQKVQAFVAPPVYYRVGQQLQQEAAATYQFRQSAEYIELQQLRGFKAGVESVTQVQPAVTTSGPTQPAAGHPAATEGDFPLPPAEPAEPPAPPATAFEDRYPILAAKCSKCHTGDEPKGGVWIDGSVPLDGPDKAETRDAIAAAIVNGRMPKQGKPLDDQERYDSLVQLFTE